MAVWTLLHMIADWVGFLSSGLDRCSRKYLPVILLSMLPSRGRRTVSSWLQAAGGTDDWQNHYCFLQTLGRSAGPVATRLLRLAIRQIPLGHVGPYVKLVMADGAYAKRSLYGVEQRVTFQPFLATYRPAGGVICVVIVKRSEQLFADSPDRWVAFFSTDPSVNPETIIEAVADCSVIEQNFHDVKEVHSSGQQQVRRGWCNVACWNLCLWLPSLVELWSWRRSKRTLKQRSDRPWDETARRPSHADRFKTLRKQVIQQSFLQYPRPQRSKRKIQKLFQALPKLVC